MALSCDMGGYDDPSEYSWIWEMPTRFARTPVGRRRRCLSCRELIAIGSDALPFHRWRVPRGEIEYRIFGDDGEVPLAPHWHCETCGGLALSLAEHGYSIDKDDDMRELVKEHAALVRIVGDAPCKNALLEHDLSLVHRDAWDGPAIATFRQVEKVTERSEPGWRHGIRLRHWYRDRITIHCRVPSLAAFEAQWKMAQAGHSLPDGCEWRIGADWSTWRAVELGVTVIERAEMGDDDETA